MYFFSGAQIVLSRPVREGGKEYAFSKATASYHAGGKDQTLRFSL